MTWSRSLWTILGVVLLGSGAAKVIHAAELSRELLQTGAFLDGPGTLWITSLAVKGVIAAELFLGTLLVWDRAPLRWGSVARSVILVQAGFLGLRLGFVGFESQSSFQPAPVSLPTWIGLLNNLACIALFTLAIRKDPGSSTSSWASASNS